MRGTPVLLPLLSAFVLLVAACQPAQPAPTAAPAKPPAKPVESPAVKPAPKPDASPAAKPAASPVAKAAPKTDVVVPKPAGDLSFKIAYSSAFGFSDVPAILTADRLNKDGWKIEHVNFAQSEVAIEAVAKGETKLGGGSTFTAMAANQKGAKLALIGERNSNEWVVVSVPAIRTCQDLNGKRLAVHSEGAVSTAMVKVWVREQCNGTPNYIVISGSENRAAAIMNGQIDATPLELSDWVKVDVQRPNQFQLLVNFSKGLASLSTSSYYANTDWLETNKPVGVAFMAEILKTHRMVEQDPKLLEEGAKKYVPEVDAAALPRIIAAYKEIDGFPVNGGLDAAKVEGTIKFFTDSGQLQPGMTVQRAANLSVLEEAYKIVDKVQGRK